MNKVKNIRDQNDPHELSQKNNAIQAINKDISFTGEGFVPIEILVDNVKAWQQRRVLAEDVDFLEKHGGIDI